MSGFIIPLAISICCFGDYNYQHPKGISNERRFRCLAGIAGLLLSQSLFAQLAVDRIIVDFTEESPNRNDVQLLLNTSETETLFINVEVLEVENPGTPEETRMMIDDPSKIGLIASP